MSNDCRLQSSGFLWDSRNLGGDKVLKAKEFFSIKISKEGK